MTDENEFGVQRTQEARAAKLYLQGGRNELINLAIINGWCRSLEDLLRGAARGHREREGTIPPAAFFDAFRLGTKDVKYYQQNGQAHMDWDTVDLIDARQRYGVWSYVEVEFSHDGKAYRCVYPDETQAWTERHQAMVDRKRSMPKTREGMMQIVRAAAAGMDMQAAIRPAARAAPTRPVFEEMQRSSPNGIHRRLP